MKFLVAVVPVLVFAVLIYEANGLCNTCSAVTGLACVSGTAFKVCNEGLPQGTPISCPGGMYCTPDQKVCDTTPGRSCAKCQTCNDKKNFACTKYNAFALCMGGDTPDTSREYVCPNGLVCSIDSETICIDSSITGIGGTCPQDTNTEQVEPSTEVAITTTPSAMDNPNGFCANIGVAGSYEISSDPTCKRFIRCSINNSALEGSVYVCPLSNYFDPKVQRCGTQLPERCSGV